MLVAGCATRRGRRRAAGRVHPRAGRRRRASAPAQIDRRVRAGMWMPAVAARLPPRGDAGRRRAVGTGPRCLWAGPGCALSHRARPPRSGACTRSPVARSCPELIVPTARAPRASTASSCTGSTRHRRSTTSIRVARPARHDSGPHDHRSRRRARATDDLEPRRAHGPAPDLVTVRAVLGRLDEIGGCGRPGIGPAPGTSRGRRFGPVERSARMAG